MIINGNQVFIDSQPAVMLNSALGKRTGTYLKKVLLAAGKALEEGGAVLPVVLNDMEEASRLQPAVNRLIRRMRKKRSVEYTG